MVYFLRYVLVLFLILLINEESIFAQKSYGRKPNKTDKVPFKNDLVIQGKAAFDSGDIVKARMIFEQVLKTNPNNAEANMFLGIIDDTQGDLKNAEIHFAKAARLAPNSTSARNNYGTILLRTNRPVEASKQFEASLKIDPKQSVALINLAQIRYGENTTASLRNALILFERADNISPEIVLIRSMVVISLQLGDAQQAAKYYQIYNRRLLQLDGNVLDPAERSNLGGALYEAGLYNEAELELRAVLNIQPSNTDAIVRLGRVLFARKDLKSAIELMETAVSQNYISASVYSLLAAFYEKTGQYDKAIPVMRLAISSEPSSEKYRFQYGLLLTNADAPAAAIIRIDEALKSFPDSPRLWLARGIAELKDSKNIEAVQSISKAVNLDPNFARAYAYLGLVKVQTGNFDEAVSQYEMALQKDPSLAVVHQMIADAMLQQSNADNIRIESELKKSIELDSRFIPAHLSLGKLYVRVQKWKEAADAFNQALLLDPEVVEAYYQLGRVYTRLNRKIEAQAALDKFKTLNESQKNKSDKELREVVRRLADVRF